MGSKAPSRQLRMPSPLACAHRFLVRPRRLWVIASTTAMVVGSLFLPYAPLAPIPVAAAPGETRRASVDATGIESNFSSSWSVLSSDGRFVAFASDGTNLVPTDTNSASDVFVKDLLTGAIERVDVSGLGTQADLGAFAPVSISGDGRYVTFLSGSTNLVIGDTNGFTDAFVRDRQASTTVRVSVASDGSQGNGEVRWTGISRNAQFVVFNSDASNLVANDLNGTGDIFVRDLTANTTQRVSVDASGREASNRSEAPAISSDGRYVAFENAGLSGANVYREIYVRDRQANTTQLASVPNGGGVTNNSSNQAEISGDGRFVAYQSQATNIVLNDSNGKVDVFVYDRVAGGTERISLASDGTQGNADSNGLLSISADGRYVAFTSLASNLVPNDTNNARDVFTRDRQTSTTQLVSVATDGTIGNGPAQATATLSADGQIVTFGSNASNLVPADSNGVADVFTHQLVVVSPGPMTFTVISADDQNFGTCSAVHCSLREAIDAANLNPGADTIVFNIPGPSPHTIQPTSPLPVVTEAVTIDGGSSPNCAGRPAIELDGALAGNPANGLQIAAGPSTIRGLVVNRFSAVPWAGIYLSGNGVPGSGGNRIECSYIGTDVSGTMARPNNIGIHIESANNVIGGASAATRNIISGNNDAGIRIEDNGVGVITNRATGNLISGNYIGTDVGGMFALPNHFQGVFLNGPSGNTVGGSAPGSGNVISGNEGPGVYICCGAGTVQGNYIGTNATGTGALGNSGPGVAISGSNSLVGGASIGARNVISANGQGGIAIGPSGTNVANGNVVRGNYIGTDATGNLALGNAAGGITLSGGPSGTYVGGGATGDGNLISGNSGPGVWLASSGTTNNYVQGNLIGTQRDGISALGNSTAGVLISDAARGNSVGGSAGGGNTIAFNGGSGVNLSPSGGSPIGIAINSNSIFSNASLGIDLGSDLVTPNDLNDPDVGPNNLQNFPVLTTASSSGGTTSVNGGLNSEPSKNYRIEFFANPACDASGFGEGARFLGATNVTTNNTGDAAFNASLPGSLFAGEVVTATATESATGNTSEFSPCRVQTGTIELTKHWTGTAGNVTLKIGTTPGGSDVASRSLVASDGSTGQQVVRVGTAYVSEQFDAPTNASDYAASPACFNDLDSNGVQNGTEPSLAPDANYGVSVGSGDHVVCTFTNVRKTGRLELRKSVVPAADAGKFNLLIKDGSGASTLASASDVGDGGSTGQRILETGTYQVSETSGTGTSLADYDSRISCADGATVVASAPGPGPLAVIVTDGANVVCTATNLRLPQINVVKRLAPASDPGRFDLKINSSLYDNSGAGFTDGGATGFHNVLPGANSVGEGAHAGTSISNYGPSISCDSGKGGNSGQTTYSFSLAYGDSVLCTITNTHASADLAITKNDAPDPVEIGHDLTYTITVTNSGPGNAEGVVVSDPLPAGTTFRTASSGGAYNPGSNTVTWSLGSISANAAPTQLTLTVNVTNRGCNTSLTFSNTASVSASTPDPVTSNNTTVPADNTSLLYIRGTSGNDTIRGGAQSELILAGAGNDIVFGGGGDDVLCGEAGDDTLVGDGGNDTLDGGPGTDTVEYIDYARPGANPPWPGPQIGWTINLSTNSARLKNGFESDSLLAVENVTGSNFDDTITGNSGPNQLVGAAGNDTIDGGPGNDSIFGMAGADTIYGGDGDDDLHGGAGDDVIHGDKGSDTIYGGPDNDQIWGGPGNDFIYGEAGNDSLAGDTEAMSNWRPADSAADGNDAITGGDGNDLIYGQGGDDRLEGGLGQDRLHGGAGNDRVDGGAGSANVLVGASAAEPNSETDNCSFGGSPAPDVRDRTCDLPSRGSAIVNWRTDPRWEWPH